MKYIRNFSIFGLLMAGVLLMGSGCQSNEAGNEAVKKPVIAVSIVPQATFAHAVCGDKAEIIVMVPPGNSPANYEPTPVEMEKFSQAKLYFTVGIPTEAANILARAEEIDSLRVVKLEDRVAEVYPDREIAPGMRDPHIWLSPKRAKVMVLAIAEEMGKLDPENKDFYGQNAESYAAELDTLDAEIKTAFAGAENKKIIVYHPAFGYLADDYGLQMFALEEEGKESTPQRLAEMIDLAKKENITAVFYQEEISSQQAQSFAEEIGGKAVQLAPLAANYTENLQNMAKLLAELAR